MIYFIRSHTTGHIKIGATQKLNIRFTQIRHVDGSFDLLGTMDGYLAEEKELHKRFKQWRINNKPNCEWYHDNPELLEYIETNIQPGTAKLFPKKAATGQRGIAIMWSDEQSKMLEQIAEKHGATMEYNGIEPYTSTTPTGERKPNTSGIIRYLLMEATGKIKGLR